MVEQLLLHTLDHYPTNKLELHLIAMMDTTDIMEDTRVNRTVLSYNHRKMRIIHLVVATQFTKPPWEPHQRKTTESSAKKVERYFLL